MEVSQVLAQLDAIKKKYTHLSQKYGEIYYGGDCPVYIGSTMWQQEIFNYLKESEREDFLGEFSEEEALRDHQTAKELIREADALLSKHGLSSLLIDGGVMYWIGALPEPYTSAY